MLTRRAGGGASTAWAASLGADGGPASPGAHSSGSDPASLTRQREGAFGTAKLRWCAAWMQWNRSHSDRVRGPKRTWGTTGPGEAL